MEKKAIVFTAFSPTRSDREFQTMLGTPKTRTDNSIISSAAIWVVVLFLVAFILPRVGTESDRELSWEFNSNMKLLLAILSFVLITWASVRCVSTRSSMKKHKHNIMHYNADLSHDGYMRMITVAVIALSVGLSYFWYNSEEDCTGRGVIMQLVGVLALSALFVQANKHDFMASMLIAPAFLLSTVQFVRMIHTAHHEKTH